MGKRLKNVAIWEQRRTEKNARREAIQSASENAMQLAEENALSAAEEARQADNAAQEAAVVLATMAERSETYEKCRSGETQTDLTSDDIEDNNRK